jgi:hypothetical protein
LKVFVTTPLKPFARATDDHGMDVGAVVAARDGNHLGGFAMGE